MRLLLKTLMPINFRFALLPVILGVGLSVTPLSAEAPRVLLEGVKLEQVASEPDIRTPVGMIFDDQGRLLVVESHTHKRPEKYEGPTSDRIRRFSDSDGDGKLDQWSTFAEGFHQSMNLLAAGPGEFYLVTRRSVDLLIDDDFDGRMDRQKPILRLESEAEYPHDGMAGIAHDGRGGLLVGLGENLGMPYKLVGTDGVSVSGRGGVGTIFHCTAEGKNLRRYCTGFWNPFSICRLPNGAMFAIDNDPDASPPCRLLHLVETGDYGHRFEYNRAGIHPLQAWNGELPGTLPMVAGTGESPCAVVPHRGYLWVTSWGDHRLERYQLIPKGASFAAEQKIVLQGDTDFRPTGCAVGPDGSLYFSDWVDHSYPVHGKGRIWRLSFTKQENPPKTFPHPASEHGTPIDLANSDDPFSRQSAVAFASHEAKPYEVDNPLVQAQISRWSGKEPSQATFRKWLSDPRADVRLLAVRWIADERIQPLADDVAKLLDGEIPDERYFLAVLSATEWLDGEPELRSTTLNDGLLARELKNPSRSPQLHALALRLLSPDNKFLTLEKLQQYLQADYQPLRLEAIRSLALQTNPNRFDLLAEVAQDTQQSSNLRAEAVSALAAAESNKKTAAILTTLASDPHPVVAQEAKRVQQLTGQHPAKAETKPEATDLAAWNQLLANQGDAAAGRRLFFSGKGARCGVCHQYGGRGGKIGPDLTRISQSNSREQITASILQPSREMGPHYQPWILQTDAGKTYVALRLHKAGDAGEEIYADTEGKTFSLRGDEIELREASDISIMPSGLEKTVSIDQLRDLVEFLSTKPE